MHHLSVLCVFLLESNLQRWTLFWTSSTACDLFTAMYEVMKGLLYVSTGFFWFCHFTGFLLGSAFSGSFWFCVPLVPSGSVFSLVSFWFCLLFLGSVCSTVSFWFCVLFFFWFCVLFPSGSRSTGSFYYWCDEDVSFILFHTFYIKLFQYRDILVFVYLQC